MIYKYALQIKAAEAKLYRLKKEKAKAQQIALLKRSRKSHPKPRGLLVSRR